MGRRGSSSSSVCGPKEETSVGRFFSCGFGVKKRFWNRQHNTKKSVEVKTEIFLLPDDILEMCLDHVPFESLDYARLVCKRWSSLITIAKVLQKKKEYRYQNLWFFVFGTACNFTHNPACSYSDVNIIHALHISRNQWHSIDADFLKGRHWFSVASVHGGIFIVGGQSNFRNQAFPITHKEVMFFNPITKSWHNMPSMEYARYLPVLGVIEDHVIPYKSSSYTNRKEYVRQRRSEHSNLSLKGIKKSFLLIAVGAGNSDSWRSGEIYDSLTNKWTEIQTLPVNFGIPLSGTVCGSMFYVFCCGRPEGSEKLVAYDIEKGFWIAIQTYLPFLPDLCGYRTQLVSSNGRLYMISRSTQYVHDSIVRKLWELDLMNLAWTEILVLPYAPVVDGESGLFVADQNLIFRLESLEGSDQILDYLSVFDASESKNAKWNNISMKYVAPKCSTCPILTRSMAVVHPNI